MDVTFSIFFALITYIMGLIVGRNWHKYVKE